MQTKLDILIALLNVSVLICKKRNKSTFIIRGMGQGWATTARKLKAEKTSAKVLFVRIVSRKPSSTWYLPGQQCFTSEVTFCLHFNAVLGIFHQYRAALPCSWSLLLRQGQRCSLPWVSWSLHSWCARNRNLSTLRPPHCMIRNSFPAAKKSKQISSCTNHVPITLGQQLGQSN